ncbi:MAG: hypothetical protein KJO98_06910 [Rhodothermia bacterium]|nr:hypothetical protein [Rhodothermia bacterium]
MRERIVGRAQTRALTDRFRPAHRIWEYSAHRRCAGHPGVVQWFAGWVYYGNGIVVIVAIGGVVGTLSLARALGSSAAVVAVAAGAYLAYLVERNLFTCVGDHVNHETRVQWSIDRHGVLLWIALVGACVLAAATLKLRALPVAVLLTCGVFVCGYLLLRKSGANGVVAGLLKPVLIAGAWACTTAVLPLVDAGSSSAEVVAFAGYRFLYFLPAVLLPDLADVDGDKLDGRATPVTVFGSKSVRSFVVLLICFSPLLLLFTAGSPRLTILLGVDLLGLWLVGVYIWVGAAESSDFVRRTVDVLAAWPIMTFLAGNAI